jgi:hypothetical protein
MKYENVSSEVMDLFKRIRDEHFPELINAKILILSCNKKRKNKGNIVLGSISKPNELVKFLTKDQEPDEGYDYIMVLDKYLIDACNKEDLEKILRHELRHTYVDLESEKNPYKLVGHNYEDFIEEVELNKDDPNWAQRAALVVDTCYENASEEDN